MPDSAPRPGVPAGLVALASHRWNVPVIGRLHTADALPFGVLATELGASREGLSRSLTALAEPGFVDRDDGRRGAYRLAPRGARLGGPCHALVDVSRSALVDDLAFRKWTLPIVAALRGWEVRFAELRALLPGISPRALTLALKDMQAAGLVERTVIGGFPPATSYRLTGLGAGLSAPVDELTRACVPGSERVD
jgi:DNA-binding HxlR family transcriptional regulator